MKTLVVDNAPKNKEFNDRLEWTVGEFSDYMRLPHTEIEDDPSKIQDFDAVIGSGVPVDYTFKAIGNREEDIELLKGFDKPYLGICLGHQSLGWAFGAEVKEEEETGQHIMGDLYKPTSRLIWKEQNDPLLEGLMNPFVVKTLHRASITVPYEHFDLLASSAHCRNQIMRHKDRPMYGVQFHPEFSGARAGKMLLRNFVKLSADLKSCEPAEVVDITEAQQTPELEEAA